MVRLKEIIDKFWPLLQYWFQFQNGSIKRKAMGESSYAFNQFQFQNGSIKSGLVTQMDCYSVVFQFQNGSIKSRQSST